jgi:UDP-N-acetylmuramoyl-tripeptide--D-alanyl-D-alanine ligase
VELTAGELARLAGGVLHDGPADARVTTWSIDSRTLEPGACFVALTAARDGHDFVADAVARGATAVLVGHPVPDTADAAVVVVDDPLAALGRLGAHARRVMAPSRVVGVTGSAGKTGTKDLVAAALRGTGPVHASPGSYNNEAGVPLTLLAAPPDTDTVVLEMGARAHGDIAALCAIARPTAGVITNIGMAHAGLLGGRAGIAQAKGELFEALPPDGVAVLDADDAASGGLAARTAARVLRVSARDTAAADVRARDVSLDAELRPSFSVESAWGNAHVHLSVHGDHQVVNALLAAAVALDAGVAPVAVAAGLEAVRPAPWRMEVLHAPRGVLVLHDAYNANPSSTEVALRALAQIDTKGRRVAVLGEMRELGAHSEEEHARIGRMVADLGIDELVAVGPETAPLAAAAGGGDVDVEVVADATAALEALLATIGPGDSVLVKGSRAVGLERVAHALAPSPTPKEGVQ